MTNSSTRNLDKFLTNCICLSVCVYLCCLRLSVYLHLLSICVCLPLPLCLSGPVCLSVGLSVYRSVGNHSVCLSMTCLSVASLSVCVSGTTRLNLSLRLPTPTGLLLMQAIPKSDLSTYVLCLMSYDLCLMTYVL